MYDDNTGTDRRISTLFHDSTAEIVPDVSGLVRGGIDRGRVKRRRRNVATAFAAAATVGMVGVAASVVPSFDSGRAGLEPAGSADTPHRAAASTSPHARATTATKAPTATKVPTGPLGGPVADIPVKAADLPRLFTRLYPGKVTPAEERTGRIINNGREGQYAHFLWNGFQTTVGFGAYSGTPAERCRELQQAERPPGVPAPPPVTCIARPDGTVLLPGRETAPARDGGGVAQGATLFTKDGYDISVISYNWARKNGPNLAAEPPLSIAQLTRAVTSDIWFH